MQAEKRFLPRLSPVLTGVLALLVATLSAMPVQASTDDEVIVSVEPAELLTQAQLRELVAPIALYSDELLAIVLPASTYPLQIVAAARYRDAVSEDPSLEPDEYWDESVVALLNYPEALDFLNADLDWTWELGQAVTDQQAEVLAAVSAYREEAYAAGNLETDEKHVVAVDDDVVTITSADPEVIHVPYYDPEEVTVYQTERVYHYYPRAYPVYYYPYSSWHRFYDDGFWGINSAFVLSWSGFYLGHHLHTHHYHPYFGRRYHRDHFRFTHRYISAPAYKKRHKYRHKHRRDHDRWYPDRRWSGDRPRHADQDISRHHPRGSHIERRNHRLARTPRPPPDAARHVRTDRQRSAVHRSPEREINSVAGPQTRSSVHRPRPQTRAQTGSEHFKGNAPRVRREVQTRNAPRQERANRDQRQLAKGGHRADAQRARVRVERPAGSVERPRAIARQQATSERRPQQTKAFSTRPQAAAPRRNNNASPKRSQRQGVRVNQRQERMQQHPRNARITLQK